ncbi:MAG: serine/threonine-protein phosphatase [Clostridia bacterium]|nr:serine/threonine-protein phosphatase [Clostridia bacterium]
MAKLSTTAALVSSIGCVRPNNEDNFFFQGDYMKLDEMNAGAHLVQSFTDSRQLYAVFDGVGGEYNGERAAYLAAHVMFSYAPAILGKKPVRAIQRYARAATQSVHADSERAGVPRAAEGSTMAMVCLNHKVAHFANVGDSRVYLFRSGSLHQMTADHTEVYTMYREGMLTSEQMRKHTRGNMIDRYIGMDPARLPDNYVYTISARLCRGDRILLCSDGLSDLLPASLIAQLLASEPDPDQAVVHLVSTALELGGKDNTTAILIDVTDQSLPKPPEVQRMRRDDDMTTHLVSEDGVTAPADPAGPKVEFSRQ